MRNPQVENLQTRIRQLTAERSWLVSRLEVAERALLAAQSSLERRDAAAYVERRRRELAEHDHLVAAAQTELSAASAPDALAVRMRTGIAWPHCAAATGELVALPRAEAERLVAAGAAVLHVAEASPADGTTH